MTLYINTKASTTYAVIGVGHGKRALKAVKCREVYLFKFSSVELNIDIG